jgi:membrane fusion protein, multidrug efflux system
MRIPSIRLRLTRVMPVALCALAALLTLVPLASIPSRTEAEAPDSATPSVLVQTTQVRRGSLPQTVVAYGSVQASSNGRVSVMSPLAATVVGLDVRVGQEVARGAPLVRLAPNPETAAAYAQAQFELRAAADSVTRTRQLLAEQLATRQQLADAEKAESDARVALAALKAQGAGGPATLRAPFRAVVTAVLTSSRSIVSEGTPLLELARTEGLVLQAGVSPDAATAVRVGEAARVTAIGGAQSHAAKVLMRGSVVDSGTGLVPVQISIPDGGLFPGQAAQATITVGTVRGFVVPHEAVLVDDNGNAYVVQAIGGVARIVPVRVLGTEQAEDTVDGPLDVRAPLVLAGNYQLKDGMAVRLAGRTTHAPR